MTRVLSVCWALLVLCTFGTRATAEEGVPCEERCQRVFEEVLSECTGPDGQITDECERRAHNAAAACREECDGEPPPPPPEPTCADRCEARYHEALAKCTREDGTVGEDCAFLARRALEECLGGCEEPPPPPPEPTCAERCELRYHDAIAECTREDGSIREECAAVARRNFEACLDECDGNEPPPEPTCPERCENRLHEALAACEREGGVSEECVAEARRNFEACLGECDGGEPPPEPGCEERCERRFHEILAECAGPDGQVSEECHARARRALEECLHGCEGEPPPVPGCEDACHRKANEVLESCANDDGTVSEECVKRSRMVLEQCLALCDREPPPPPDDCEGLCDRVFREVLASCTRDDGTITEECEALAREARAGCVRRCTGEEPPEPPSCESACKERAAGFIRECLADGNDPGECEARARMIIADCLEDCDDGEEPPEPGCKDRCAAAAVRQAEACIAEGGDPERCRAAAAEFLERCVEGCEDQPPPTCLEHCRHAFEEALEDCVATAADGFDAEGCRARLEEVYANCRRECEPPPPSCEAECRQRGERALAACTEEGGGPDECAAHAARVVAECVAEHCRPDEPPPEPPSCDDRCEAHFRELVAHCMENGGTREECSAKARPSLEECLIRCQDQPPPSCAERCELASAEVLEMCLSHVEDGDEDGVAHCRMAARSALEKCRSGCERPDPPSCEDRCAAAGRELRARCLELGDDADECEMRVAMVIERCVEGCNEPPPEPPLCEDRCEDGGNRVFRACRDNGGEEDECAAEAVSFTRRCVEQCRHGPAPDCGDDCAHTARRFLAECLEGATDAAGNALGDVEGTEEECKERATEILKHCLARCEHDPATCEERCAQRARDVHSRCLERSAEKIAACVEEGGDEEECRAAALRECRAVTNDFLANCINESCERPEPEPPGCEERCEAAVARLLEECEANGGENCAAHAEELRARCHAACGDPEPLPPCEVDCDEIAAKLAERCAASDLSPEQCEREIAAFIEHCEARLGDRCNDEVDAQVRAPIAFRRGDVNRDRTFNISDISATLGGLFLGDVRYLVCEDAADMNDDGDLDVSDAIFGLMHLFASGLPIPHPAGEEGHDPTADTLLCLPQ